MDRRPLVARSRSTGPVEADPGAPTPVLIGSAGAGAAVPHEVTPRHQELVLELTGTGSRSTTWAERALRECLVHLRTSTVTQARRVRVVDAWTEGPEVFCVLYGPPFDEARVVGLRRGRQAAVDVGEWRLGDLTTWGYEMGRGEVIDPVAFAHNVADFDIGEPLGFVVTVLRYDDADVGWWGDLEDELPVTPDRRRRR